MSIERIIGIDFGTSTSVIRVKRYEDGKPLGEILETKEVIFGGVGAMVPTLIQNKDDDEKIVYYGYDAQQKRKKTTTYHSFKVALESENPEKRAEARKITEEFFVYLAKVYSDQSKGGHLGAHDDQEHTVISYPVKWSEDTRAFMLEAAANAGFPNVTGMDEAEAAIQAVTIMNTEHLKKNALLKEAEPTNLLLIDMGAGTTDLVLCRYTPGNHAVTEILNTWPKAGDIFFGGKEVDVLLKKFFWDKMDEVDADVVFKKIGTDKFKTWKENTVSPALTRGDSVCDFEPLDSCVEMLEIDMDEYCLDRKAFEECMGSYLEKLPILINDCLKDAGMSGSEIDLVIVTGGHSQWYFVREMLQGNMPQFGVIDLAKIKENPSRIIPISRPQETVALGLAYSPMKVDVNPVDEENERKCKEAEIRERVEKRKQEDDERKKEEMRKSVEELNRKKQETCKQEEVEKKSILERDWTKVPYELESKFEIEAKGKDCIIKKYLGNNAVVSIPPMINGKKVVGIGRGAFSGITAFHANKSIEIVIIPETIKIIGRCAFWGCSNLKQTIAHKNIEKIDFAAFLLCKSLESIDFGMGKRKVQELYLPPTLKIIGAQAFTNGQKAIYGPYCTFKKVFISRGTKVKDSRLYNKNFDPQFVDVYYYD